MVYFAVVFAVAASIGLIAVPPLGLGLIGHLLAWLIYSGCLGAVLAVPFAVIGWRADRRPHRTPQEREATMATVVVGSCVVASTAVQWVVGREVNDLSPVWMVAKGTVIGAAMAVAVIGRRRFRVRSIQSNRRRPYSREPGN